MEHVIFSINLYVTELIYEILLIIFIFLATICSLFLIGIFIKYLLNCIYNKFYPHKTAKIAPIPFSDITNIDLKENIENRFDNITIDVI